ncbi:MAG TPA: phage Gp37/Gp68 family protein [Candidatus Binataceae bacterium]
MGYRSQIEWTDATWNPVRGCIKISPSCKHCYAERFAERFRGVSGHPFEFGFDLRLVPEKLEAPLKWRAPKRIFVNSMSDLFLESVPTQYIARIGEVMRAADWHTFQVLTKRHERMHTLLNGELRRLGTLPNVWWGVSVEDREYGLPRIDVLSSTNAAIRFLSIEPLLERLGELDLSGIDWVIVGGESGTRPRPISPDWVREIRDQCQAAGVPFFFKQWGGRSPKQFGRILDGREWNEMPIMVREQTSQSAVA